TRCAMRSRLFMFLPVGGLLTFAAYGPGCAGGGQSTDAPAVDMDADAGADSGGGGTGPIVGGGTDATAPPSGPSTPKDAGGPTIDAASPPQTCVHNDDCAASNLCAG